mgnify:CR=1 FL=1
MKVKLAHVFAVVVVVAMVLMTVAPTAVLARPPRPGLEKGEDPVVAGATRDMTPEQLRAALEARALKAGKPDDIPNPRAAARLAANEARMMATGKSPKAAGLGLQGVAKLLVIPVEFAGTETFTEYLDPEDCTVTRTVTIVGPLHNQIPDPAPYGDNFTFWLPDFSQEVYSKLFFDTGPTGGVGVVRRDLNNGAGVDLSGLTAANYYLEQSGGVYRLTGTVLPWVQLPVSEGHYGADPCGGGHDVTPRWQLARDAVAKVKELYPDFNWSEFDTDSDGIIDHLVIIHAGADQSAGGGREGTFALWAHSSAIAGGFVVDDRGTADPADDIRAWNYTLVPENADIGVIVHEYGHDIGLPDLYDTTYGATDDVAHWDVMSAGSWSGPLGGVRPTSIGLWGRVMLGWADPVVLDVNSPEQVLTVGQLSGKPAGTADGAIVRLPLQVVRLETPASPAHMWWSNNDRNMSEARLWRRVDLSASAAPITFGFKANWVIEEDWDFAFVEASADGGVTWVPLPDINGHTLPEDYADPYGNQTRFRGKYGITGASSGWTDLAFDLSAFAGQDIRLRLRYNTDEFTVEKGLFADDFELVGAGGTIWSDDVESGAGEWSKEDLTADGGMPGKGWVITDGVFSFPHYYLLEWRNSAGFDKDIGAYVGYYSTPEAWAVSPVPYSVPGALLWYRNFFYSSNSDIYGRLFDPPSWGPKGALLIVDSHPSPMTYPRVPGSGMGGRTMGGRVQTANSTFSLRPTTGYNVTTSEWLYDYLYGSGTMTTTGQLYTGLVPSEPGVGEFHDSLGYFPGIVRVSGRDYWVDYDASVVIPSTAPYWPKWVPFTSTGNPGRGAYGVNLVIVDQAADGTWGKVRIYNNSDTFISRKFVDKPQARKGDIVTITIVMKDSAGSRYSDDAPYDYEVVLADAIPAGCSFVAGSITGGAQFVPDNQHSGSADTGQITWRGTIGGRPLSEPDAVITYKVRVNMDAPVGRAMVSSGLVRVLGAGATGYVPKQSTYTLAETITVAPSRLILPSVMKNRVADPHLSR